jgi:hypothetical protein
MAANIHNTVLDAALNYVKTNGTQVYICSALPATLTEATTTYGLGHKDTPTIGDPSERGAGGREVTVTAITDGTVTASGTASHWAIVYAGGTAVLAAQTLGTVQVVTSGNTFTLTAFTVGIPDPT